MAVAVVVVAVVVVAVAMPARLATLARAVDAVTDGGAVVSRLRCRHRRAAVAAVVTTLHLLRSTPALAKPASALGSPQKARAAR
jgi:hypothetical protein